MVEQVYRNALLDLPQMMPVVVPLDKESLWSGSSERSSAAIRELIGISGHRLVNTGTGKHVYFLYLFGAGLADAELQALILQTLVG